ncbi:MAG: hypothetical protein SGPRY_004709 [Prymnesium sp.]
MKTVEVGFSACSGAVLPRVLQEQMAFISQRINVTPLPAASLPSRAVPISESETEVRVQTLEGEQISSAIEAITLTLMRGCVWLNEAKLEKRFPDAQMREDVRNWLHCYDHSTLRAQLGNGGKRSTTLNGQFVEVSLGEDFFLSSGEARLAKAL